MQIQDVQVRSKRSNNSGKRHYHLNKKSRHTKALKLLEKSKDCQEEWGRDEDKEKLTTPISVTSHYKKYNVEERKIVVQKPNRENFVASVLYDGQEEAMKINLAQPRGKVKPMNIVVDLSSTKEEELIELLKEYKDVFAYSYKDLKWVDPQVC